MSGPWEDFQKKPNASGPWSDFQKSTWSDPLDEGIPGLRTPAAPPSGTGAQMLKEAGLGLVRGVAGPFETLTGATPQERVVLTEGMRRFGIDPESGAFKTGRVVGEAIMGATGASALGRMVGGSMGRAIATGGLAKPGAESVMAGIGTRATGGAIGGGAGAAIVNPELAEVAGGAAFGAGLGLGAGAVGKIHEAIGQPFFSSQRVVRNVLGDVTEGVDINALARESAVGPSGARRTLGEMATAATGKPLLPLSTFEQRARFESSRTAMQDAYDFLSEQRSVIAGQLEQVNNQLIRQAKVLAPEARNNLQQVRDSLLREQAATEQQLSFADRALKQQLEGPSRYVAGETIQSQALAGQEAMRAGRIRPQYREAFDLAGDTKIDLTPLVKEAEELLGQPLSEIDPKTAPAIVSRLRALGQAPTPKAPISDFPGAPPPPTPVQPMATLEEADALRSALNAARRDARQMGGQQSAVISSNLNRLHQILDDAIKNSPVDDAAKDAYKEAVRRYREEFVPAYRSDVTGKLLKPTYFSDSMILPENTVGAYLTETGARQFLTTFANDPIARQSLEDGVVRLLREAALDPKTRALDLDKTTEFLAKNEEVLDVLQQGGLNIRGKLEQFQKQVADIQAGRTELETVGKTLGKASAADIVDSALKDRVAMAALVRKIDDRGRLALSDAVASKVVDQLEALDPVKATKFLVDNEATARIALGKDAYADLLKLSKDAELAQQTLQKLKTLDPNVQINVTDEIRQRLANVPAAQIPALRSLAEEVAQREMYVTAGQAGKPGLTSAGEVVEEGQVQISQLFKNFLNRYITITNKGAMATEGRVNQRAMSELVALMYREPEEAVRILREAQAAKRPPVISIRAATQVGVGNLGAERPETTQRGRTAPTTPAPTNQNRLGM